MSLFNGINAKFNLIYIYKISARRSSLYKVLSNLVMVVSGCGIIGDFSSISLSFPSLSAVNIIGHIRNITR